eukprot:3172182-Rhodomonas_salina.1
MADVRGPLVQCLQELGSAGSRVEGLGRGSRTRVSGLGSGIQVLGVWGAYERPKLDTLDGARNCEIKGNQALLQYTLYRESG